MKKICTACLFFLHFLTQGQSIVSGDSWKYYDLVDSPQSTWKAGNFNDNPWSIGTSELGYGDSDESTVIDFGGNSSNKITSYYFRKTITLSNQVGLSAEILYDDGAVVYINGVEVQRFNMPSGVINHNTFALNASPEGIWVPFLIPSNLVNIGVNTIAVEVHQTSLSSSDVSFDFKLTPLPPEALYINELVSSNATSATDTLDENPDWIEILNSFSISKNLKNHFITDDPNDLTKHQFSQDLIIPALSRLVLWANGDATLGESYLNFSLSKNGEFVALVAPDGLTIIDSLSFPSLPTDVGFGRKTDGSSELKYLSPTTVGFPNNDTYAFNEILEPPTFSHEAGFYQNNFNVSLTHNDPNVEIIYSLDGSEPNPSLSPSYYNYVNDYVNLIQKYRSTISSLYQTPILIQDRSTNPNEISEIKTGVFGRVFPDGLTYKGTPVRAIATKSGALRSEAITKTYFIGNQLSRYNNLTVASINTNEQNLFDYDSGIYVKGANTNFNESWEKKASLELIDNGTLDFQQNLGIRIHGGGSRFFDLKSFRFYARSEFGNSEINYDLFEDEFPPVEKRFLLRNSGSDFVISNGNSFPVTLMFRDAYIHEAIKHLNVTTQRYRPTAAFVNGEFWGIMNLRDRLDKFYLATKYGVDENNIDLITPGDNEADEGSITAYDNMIAYFNAHNDFETNPARLSYAKNTIDIKNYIDYQIIQQFFNNTDWPHKNKKLWRNKVVFNGTEAEGSDGRWRWLLYDTDYGMLTHLNRLPAFASEQVIFKKLLTNNEFKNQYLNRYADLLNSTFKTDRLIPLFNSLANNIAPVMQEHIDRWRTLDNINKWITNQNNAKNFLQIREGVVVDNLEDEFNIDGQFDLTVSVSSNLAGFIKVNTLNITPETEGINSNPYPWTGEYFENIPVLITAKPFPGYKFKEWQTNGQVILDSTITIDTTSDVNYLAIFEEDFISMNPLPVASILDGCGYDFKSWSVNSSEGTHPAHIKFVYFNEEDPSLNASIEGFTSGSFDETSKTRINGLNDDGISIINTGSGRDGYPETKLGGLLLALNTTQVDSLKLSFLAGTVEPKSREYNLRLQYRIGDKLPFQDFTPLIEYQRNVSSNHEQQFELWLPQELLGKPYIQILWRYYYTGVRNNSSSGARDELRIDDIVLSNPKEIASPSIIDKSYTNYSSITSNTGVISSQTTTLEAAKFIQLLPGYKVENTVQNIQVTGCPE